MCRAKEAELLKHFENEMMNVNGLPISERSHRLHLTSSSLAKHKHSLFVKLGAAAA
jgi:phosphoserine aminotransferase